MNCKSLLLSAAMLTVSAGAFAFPTLTVSPTPDKTYDSKDIFASFNISISGATLDTNKLPLLVNDYEGEELVATRFMYFMDTIIINFDSDDVVVNGDWELQIPVGAITINGESNPLLTYSYILNDVNLNTGAFPQITLESITPAEGSKIPAWGGNLSRVSMTTSNDGAVNLISWSLYDVTKGEGEDEAEYVRSGSENRIDYNRNLSNDDMWVNGLYFTIGGEPDQLVEGNKYRLDLKFYGIGYDPVTNQYATPQQQAQSLELSTSVYYYGQTPAPEYSAYTYVSISPDPEKYEITSAETAFFDVTFTGPVHPENFKYSLGMGASADAGTIEPMGDNVTTINGITYADMWEFHVDPEVLKNTTGTLITSFQAKDADGLYVKALGDYLFNNNIFTFSWVCNTGAPTIVPVYPYENVPVTSLSEITVTNQPADGSPALVMSPNDDGSIPAAEIRTRDGAVVRELEKPTISSDNKSATWTFLPITEPGSYILMVPKSYFNCGEETSGSFSLEAYINYIVESDEPAEVTYDLVPLNVAPAEGTITELSKVDFTFEPYTNFTYDTEAELYFNDQLLEKVTPADTSLDFFVPDAYAVEFSKTYTDKGTYKLVIPAATFADDEYMESSGKSGHANAELTYTYTIGVESGVDAIVEGVEYNVFNLQGVMILNNADAAAVKALPAGLYIVNGNKVIVK